MLIDWNFFTGERCGLWASCLSEDSDENKFTVHLVRWMKQHNSPFFWIMQKIGLVTDDRNTIFYISKTISAKQD